MQVGVDEVGLGSLAGPLVAGAVVLGTTHGIEGLRDSKKMSAKSRDKVSQDIVAKALSWSIGIATKNEIEEMNVLAASHLAMQRAIFNLAITPSLVLVDGKNKPRLPFPTRSVVKGDDKVREISAASIIAKVCRDKIMEEFSASFPQYEFERNKGYPTKKHLMALDNFGPTFLHRRTFAPVSSILGELDEDKHSA